LFHNSVTLVGGKLEVDTVRFSSYVRIGLSCKESYIWLLMLGDVLGGSGGGDRFGGFIWIGVLSDWMHWLINGISNDDEEVLFDFERLKVVSVVFIGEVDLVREILSSILFVFEWRKEDWNDVERVNGVFDGLRRSKFIPNILHKLFISNLALQLT
jgi:hypothetical protein